MLETRLSVRVDQKIKKQAEAVFTALGMNMSTGINIYLSHKWHVLGQFLSQLI